MAWSCQRQPLFYSVGETQNHLAPACIYFDRGKYELLVPEFDSKWIAPLKFYGGHGIGFEFNYSDSTTLYYVNDWAIVSNNYPNYQSIGFEYPHRSVKIDTVIKGQHANGMYWKEIIKNETRIGYNNVSMERIELFESSISSITYIPN